MVPEIGEGFYRMKTVKAIRDTVASTFSRRGNYTQEFELIRSIDRSEQGDMTFTQYYTSFTTSWDWLDHLQSFQPACTTDAEEYRKFLEKQRFVVGFLGWILFLPFKRPSLMFRTRRVVVP